MILCATLASAGLWLLLQRTKTDTRWRQFQPKVWFGRRSAPTLFNPWETVPICPTGSIQGLQILSTGPSASFETSTDSTSRTNAGHCDQIILFSRSSSCFHKDIKAQNLINNGIRKRLYGFVAMRETGGVFIQTAKTNSLGIVLSYFYSNWRLTKSCQNTSSNSKLACISIISYCTVQLQTAMFALHNAHPYWWQPQRLNILT